MKVYFTRNGSRFWWAKNNGECVGAVFFLRGWKSFAWGYEAKTYATRRQAVLGLVSRID